MFKLIIFLMLIGVVASLFSGLFFLFRDHQAEGSRTAKALTLRVGLSIALFILLMLGFQFGWLSR